MTHAYLISIALSSAISLEVAAYPKPGNVHRLHDYEDTRFEDFLITSHVMQPIFIEVFNNSLREERVDIGRAIYLSVKFAKRIHKNGNTNLGLATLLIPLAASAPHCLPELNINRLATEAVNIVKNSDVNDAIMFYKAIREAAPSYIKKNKPKNTNLPDVYAIDFEYELKKNNYTLWDVLIESATWDLVSKELISGYPESLLVKSLIEKNLSKLGWNNSVVLAYIYLLSLRPDSLVIRKSSEEIARSIMDDAKLIYKKKINSRAGWKLLNMLDKKLYSSRLNPGATADIIASGIAFYNIQKMVENLELIMFEEKD
jgi:triphosphoribosyl-dephospho-CoA synthase